MSDLDAEALGIDRDDDVRRALNTALRELERAKAKTEDLIDAAVRAAGRVLGAYHFARPITTGDTVDEQVAAFLAAAPDADLWVIDREKDGANGTITSADTRKFVAAVQATGRRIGLYASESAFRDYGQDFAWVAHWGTEPVIAYDLWQYRGAPLDLDRFRGTRGGLLALGAPRREWVDATITEANGRAAAAEFRAIQAEEQVARLTNDLTVVTAQLGAAHAEIADVATGLRLVRQFEEAHP